MSLIWERIQTRCCLQKTAFVLPWNVISTKVFHCKTNPWVVCPTCVWWSVPHGSRAPGGMLGSPSQSRIGCFIHECHGLDLLPWVMSDQPHQPQVVAPPGLLLGVPHVLAKPCPPCRAGGCSALPEIVSVPSPRAARGQAHKGAVPWLQQTPPCVVCLMN